MLALPRGYLSSLCEVKSLTNELLALGRVAKIDNDALEIAAGEDERMPLLQYRTPAKLFVHNSRLGSQVLVGITYLSTEVFARFEEVKPLQDFERRGAFRVNLLVPGHLYPLWSDAQQADFDKRVADASPEDAQVLLDATHTEVKLLDISLTGLRLSSAKKLRVGDRYYIEFVALETPMHFGIQVQRIINTPTGAVQYGCTYVDFTERQLDLLCRDLFQLQRIEKNRRRNLMY